MNPWLWLLFVLAAAVVLFVVVLLALAVVKAAREVPPRRGPIVGTITIDHDAPVFDQNHQTRGTASGSHARDHLR